MSSPKPSPGAAATAPNSGSSRPTEFRLESGLTCTFEVLPEHTRFGYHLSDVIHRSVRELLTNVRKHADARHVRVLSGRYDGVCVRIVLPARLLEG